MINVLFTELTYWQVALLAIYTIYSLVRGWFIFDQGFKYALIGRSRDIKLYHLIWGIVDIPAIIIGTIYPVIKFIFSMPIVPLKRK